MAVKKRKKKRRVRKSKKKYVYYRDKNGNLRRRKAKRNYKRLKRIIIGLIVVALFGVYSVAQKDAIALRKLGYSRKERKVLLAKSDAELQEYLKLDHAIDIEAWDEYSNSGYYYDYELYESYNPELAEISVVHYVDDFYDVYNELEILGFKKDFCRKKWKSWTVDDFKMFADYRIDYDSVEKYLSYDEAILDDLPLYKDSEYDGIEAIMRASYKFIDSSYSTKNTYFIEDPEKLGVLVKEGFTLDDYEPEDLVNLSVKANPSYSGNDRMTEEAANALSDLFKAAKKEKHVLLAQDAYISYDQHKAVYDAIAKEQGNVMAATTVGKPGEDEHQTGLAVDVTSQDYLDSSQPLFMGCSAYKWLKDHAHEYGFIIRYPKGTDEMTGKIEDDADYCHLRYVGKDMAQDIYDMDFTLEEYLLTYGLDFSISTFEE